MSGSKSSFAKVCSKYTGYEDQRFWGVVATATEKGREKKKELRTPLGETLAVVTQTDEREAGGG